MSKNTEWVTASLVRPGDKIAVFERWDAQRETWALGVIFTAQNDVPLWFDTFSIRDENGFDHVVEVDEEVLRFL